MSGLEDGDVMGAFAAGFVNPYSTGYAVDVILCWLMLALWVLHDARVHAVKKGWICLVLGVAPGVVVGFALYLVLRNRQVRA